MNYFMSAHPNTNLILLGERVVFLFSTTLILVILAMIPIIKWIIAYYRVTRRTSPGEWLEDPERTKITFGAHSMKKAAIHSLSTLSGWKRGIALIYLTIFLVIFPWLVWEGFPAFYITPSIQNDDIRVFEADIDSEIGLLSIRGTNTVFLDVRTCRVRYLLPYPCDVRGTINFTSCWNFTGKISASSGGFAGLSIEYRLYSTSGNPIDNVELLSMSVTNGSVENSTIQERKHQFGYTCQSGTGYAVGIVLIVTLEGNASVSGLEEGSSAELWVYNATITPNPQTE
jgi:hypothetical protein